jgi:hypothetical protein
MTSSRPGWTRLALTAAVSAISIAAIATPAAPAATYRASTASITARSTAATDRALAVRTSANRLLEGRRRHLARCLQRHPNNCATWRTAVERAQRRLNVAETRLADMRAAPLVTLSGETLSWAQVTGAGAYVVKSRAPGTHESHWIVYGTSVTPPAVPGATLEYTVRTAARNSEWSAPVTISYPATSPPSGETGSGAGSGSGSGGGSGSGSGPGSVSETGSGTGSGSETGSGTRSSGFETGVVPTTLAGSEPGTVKALGAQSVRMEFPIGAPASQLASAVEAYARVGLRVLPLAGFYGSIPSPAEARNLAGWAATYGPGGTFWAGKSFPASVAVTDIEFGNETSYVYQYSDNSAGGYAARAQAYAIRFKEAEIAVKAVAPSVGLLAQADDGGTGSASWVNNMFAAVPDLASRVAGWTVHPYGTTWQQKLDNVVNFTAANGAPSSIPIYITELGMAVDNGHCVSSNYGWNPCMTNSEAAATLSSVFTKMRTRYAARLKALYLYQAQDQQPEGASNDRESYFGLLQSNGATKGAYTTEVETVLSSSESSAGSPNVRATVARRTTRHWGHAAKRARHHRRTSRASRTWRSA